MPEEKNSVRESTTLSQPIDVNEEIDRDLRLALFEDFDRDTDWPPVTFGAE